MNPKSKTPLFWMAAVLAACLGLSAVFILSSSFAPVPRQQQQTPLIPTSIKINENVDDTNYKNSVLDLDWPVRLLKGDKAVLTLAVHPVDGNENDPAGSSSLQVIENTEIPLLDENQAANIVAAARLEMEGMDAFPGEKRVPLLPGQQPTFSWELKPNQTGAHRGKVWLHLEIVPKQGGEVQRVLVLARPIEIDVVPVAGMPLTAARLVGIGCLAGSFFLFGTLFRNRDRGA